MTESKRVKDFRLGLAKQIPKFPNNRASLRALQAKPLGQLLIDYVNWRIRLVAPHPRAIMLESSATSDSRWHGLATEIQALLKKVEQGDDLTLYLSDDSRTRGFTPAASGTAAKLVDRWADKDMLLNVMGYHHFHFDAFPKRSNDVLFAHVTRDTFTVVGIFDHTVFEFLKKPMTAERDRLWQIFQDRAALSAPPGSVAVQSLITTSGHPVYVVNLASNYARVIREIDLKLDDPSFVRWFYQQAGFSVPAKPKLRWHLQHLDLGILDKENRGIFCPRGP